MGRKKKRLRLIQARKKNTAVVAPKPAPQPKVTAAPPAPKKVVEAPPEVPPNPQKASKVTKLQSDLSPVETKKPTNN